MNANEASMIIKNISIAGPKLQAALLSIIQQQQFFHPGMIAPITFDIVFYTIVTDEEYHHLRSDLRCCFDILHITLPPLCTRKEDICELFQSYVMQLSPDKRAHQLTPLMKEILTQYSWPGNVRELRAVSTRYVLLLKKAARHTVQHRYESLLNAIGQDTLRHDIYTQYHALLERPIKDMASFYAGLKLLHLFFSQTYEELAQELGLSRTTLWRIKKEVSGYTPLVTQKKRDTRSCVSLFFVISNFLSSQGASPQVRSAFVGLTAVFGMGTGGSLQLSSLNSSRRLLVLQRLLPYPDNYIEKHIHALIYPYASSL